MKPRMQGSRDGVWWMGRRGGEVCMAGAGESSRMVNRVGGEIFAKTAKTPPLQSGVCGDIIAIRVPPIASPPCAYHAVYGDVRFS